MPSWPPGVQTATIIFGAGFSPFGNPTSSKLVVTPIFAGTKSVVWSATSTPMLPFSETASSAEGTTGTAQIPVVDQTGWLDDGQHAYTLWGYRLDETNTYGTSKGPTRTKYCQPLTGQSTIYFDDIPDGSLGVPVSGPLAAVTSVNGQTGAVTVAGASDADIAALVDDPASATAASLAATYSALNGSSRLAIGGAQLDPAAIGADPAGAAAAVTLAGLGGITADAVDTKVSTAITSLVGAAPAALDTLKEIDDQISTDEGAAAALAALVAGKAPLASPALTGTPTAPTAATSESSTTIATTAYVQAVFASGLASETQTLLNAMTVRPDLTRQAAIDTFVRALKTAGVWTLLDGLYVPAAHSAQAGLLNWVARARDLTAINAPAFTTDRGYTGDASTQYLSNGVNSNTSTNYVSAAASMHFWSVSDIANDNYLDMTTDSGNAYINSRNVAGTVVARMNYSGTVGGAVSSAVTASTGLSSWARDSTNVNIYKNGTLLTSVARAPEALAAVPVYFLRGNSSSQYSARQMALGAYGGTLSATQLAAFYNAALNYMIAVGVTTS